MVELVGAKMALQCGESMFSIFRQIVQQDRRRRDLEGVLQAELKVLRKELQLIVFSLRDCDGSFKLADRQLKQLEQILQRNELYVGSTSAEGCWQRLWTTHDVIKQLERIETSAPQMFLKHLNMAHFQVTLKMREELRPLSTMNRRIGQMQRMVFCIAAACGFLVIKTMELNDTMTEVCILASSMLLIWRLAATAGTGASTPVFVGSNDTHSNSPLLTQQPQPAVPSLQIANANAAAPKPSALTRRIAAVFHTVVYFTLLACGLLMYHCAGVAPHWALLAAYVSSAAMFIMHRGHARNLSPPSDPHNQTKVRRWFVFHMVLAVQLLFRTLSTATDLSLSSTLQAAILGMAIGCSTLLLLIVPEEHISADPQHACFPGISRLTAGEARLQALAIPLAPLLVILITVPGYLRQACVELSWLKFYLRTGHNDLIFK